jgi:hypothetical protein
VCVLFLNDRVFFGMQPVLHLLNLHVHRHLLLQLVLERWPHEWVLHLSSAMAYLKGLGPMKAALLWSYVP